MSAAVKQSLSVADHLAQRLRAEVEGDVLFDAFSRGRYATDASIYQIEPVGVLVPRRWDDVTCAIQIAAEEGISILPRGGGTSQCGQTVGQSLVIDNSAFLNRLVEIDPHKKTAIVEPGIVLDQLNHLLAGHGLMFPVDVSTASRATIGGMTGNNSCGARSIRYGTMRDNVLAINAISATGQRGFFGDLEPKGAVNDLTRALLEVGRTHAAEIDERFPKVQRRVGGYNIDALVQSEAGRVNLSHLLVGSEGTLAFSEQIHLKLSQVPRHKTLGVCHFPSFYSAMDASQHLVKLNPSAVELVDRTMIDLSREIPLFRPVIERCVRGEPDAILLVEFSGDDEAEQIKAIRLLHELMADLGFPDAVVDAIDPSFQKEIWEVRKAGLNIMMSMKGDGKPISFIEDCAVRLEDLAEYTRRLTEIFSKHGTSGTWYAHASVGCLHVRPVLNVKQELDVRKMRAIAEEAFAMVREYKGSHSGEHGDGLVRSEFHEPMFGRTMVKAFEQVKTLFDPTGIFNPGKIVNPSKMDDRSLFRYKPGYHTRSVSGGFDWSAWGGFGGAVEMCNNNGACRKFDAGVMCPSYRVTREEKHLTRGRANSLRLALSNQLEDDAFTSPQMLETMQLCVGCKGCKRECPTGVDMAKMKTEFLHHYYQKHRRPLRERLIGHLPRYARLASRFSGIANLRNKSPLLARLSEALIGFSAERPLPTWLKKPFDDSPSFLGDGRAGEVVLFGDTFNRYFESANLEAALKVLLAAGYRVHFPKASDNSDRPLCCGRTYLSSGMLSEARAEAQRTLKALKPYLEKGMAVVGLEPSCLYTFKDEIPSLISDAGLNRIADRVFLIEEFLAGEGAEAFAQLRFSPGEGRTLWLHGHCHQKAFNTLGAVTSVLSNLPGTQVKQIASSCCGMAGSFGYQKETQAASIAMAELSLLPALKGTEPKDLVVADGFSCRHQISDLSDKNPLHVIRVLAEALD